LFVFGSREDCTCFEWFCGVLVWCLDITGGIIMVKTSFSQQCFVERHTVEVILSEGKMEKSFK